MVAQGRDSPPSSVVRVKGQAHPTSSLEVNGLLRHLELVPWHPWKQQCGHPGKMARNADYQPYPSPTESGSAFTR